MRYVPRRTLRAWCERSVDVRFSGEADDWRLPLKSAFPLSILLYWGYSTVVSAPGGLSPSQPRLHLGTHGRVLVPASSASFLPSPFSFDVSVLILGLRHLGTQECN
jgi:hypothetical protein